MNLFFQELDLLLPLDPMKYLYLFKHLVLSCNWRTASPHAEPQQSSLGFGYLASVLGGWVEGRIDQSPKIPKPLRELVTSPSLCPLRHLLEL